MSSSPFSFLSLPNDASMRVIRVMSSMQQISLSLCSKTAMDLITSAKLKCQRFDVGFDRTIHISINFDVNSFALLAFFSGSTPDKNNSSLFGKLFGNDSDNNWYTYEKQTFDVRDWIDHLLRMFQYSNVDYVNFTTLWFETDVVREIFTVLLCKKLIIGANIQPEYCLQLLRIFPLECVKLDSNPFSATETRRFLCKNFKRLYLGENFNITLNDLLLVNAHTVLLEVGSILEEKSLNKFIKHWIYGSQTRLEKIIIMFGITARNGKSLDPHLIFNKIDHKMRADEENVYKIKGMNGTNAPITLPAEPEDDRFIFKMLVH